MTQQDDITQRLRDNADLDEAEHGNARVVQLEREAADEIERLRAELSKLRAPVADERAAFEAWATAIAEKYDVTRNGDHYMEPYTEWVWEAWQASRAALASAPSAGQQPIVHQHGFAADNQRLRAINESLDKQLEEVMTERDNREDVIDKLLDIVLGADRSEWSSEYGYGHAVIEVEERMHALASAPVGDERAAQEYGSPADVAQRIEQYLAQDGRMNSGTQLLYEAMKALRASQGDRNDG